MIDEDHASKAEIDIHESNIYDLARIMLTKNSFLLIIEKTRCQNFDCIFYLLKLFKIIGNKLREHLERSDERIQEWEENFFAISNFREY